ncbi:MAG TPA: hypothetical protein VN258_01945 [Mobilitalea sp.]|nr:hypothetical protein [Mobilitalea sp.]
MFQSVDGAKLLSRKQQEELKTIQQLYDQQSEMYCNRIHKTDNRIVVV